MQEFKIENFSYIISFLLVVAIPLTLIVATEYMLTKKVSVNLFAFTLLLSVLIYVSLVVQIKSSKTILNEGRILIQSQFYNDEILLSDVQDILLLPIGLPEGLSLKHRKNGIALLNYKTGLFTMNNGGDAFVQMLKPPFIVISVKSKRIKYIISSSEVFYSKLLELNNDG